MLDLAALLEGVLPIVRDAGRAVLKVYAQAFEVYEKEDQSPLTEADLAAHRCIAAGLRELAPDIPVISEESELAPYAERKGWARFWLVDPLDGTKEFVGRTGEFTVNVALIEGGQPILGVVYAPVIDLMYAAHQNGGAVRISGEEHVFIHVVVPSEMLRVVASRRHGGAETQAYLESLNRPYETVIKGSSLKICMVADGQADLYPRFGPTMEWDTAAADAIVREAGGSVKDFDGVLLKYGKENMLNPYFLVSGQRSSPTS